MKKATTKSNLSKEATKIKINPKLNSIEDEIAPFIRKKMEKGKKIFAKAPLPK